MQKKTRGNMKLNQTNRANSNKLNRQQPKENQIGFKVTYQLDFFDKIHKNNYLILLKCENVIFDF
ncbi:unnamed protein product (macronuclear) [Paramecium tetraurelia]|uniref:Uncharacterized protein n=1 Tax=Paramecium tetraurelia TaxID=5888 RepID=A0DDM0_PARTE|nr:uncharacterized protein GSPATT00039444001 [Paramecium tetraurelia]CAK81137.1 unnamed protein product [Paramecium tetraurelia]|eukprot:XP_001448534.1 hypothetical protein (macronuclear) [Paramecium tetraurelia strain d4-2]